MLVPKCTQNEQQYWLLQQVSINLWAKTPALGITTVQSAKNVLKPVTPPHSPLVCNSYMTFEGLADRAAEFPQSSNKPNTLLVLMLSVMNTKGQSSPLITDSQNGHADHETSISATYSSIRWVGT